MSNLLEYVCLTGLFLSLVVMFYNRGYTGSNRFLGAFFFFASLYTIGLCIGFYGDYLKLSAWLGPSTVPFYYLIGPFSFLYVRSVLRDNPRLSRFDYLHFAIFFIQILGMLPYYFSSWEHKMEIARIIQSENWTMPFLAINVIPPIINFVLRPVQMTVYLIVQWYMIWKYHRVERVSVPSVQRKTTRRWLYIFMSVTTLWFINTINIYIGHLNHPMRAAFLEHIQPTLFLAATILVILIVSLLLLPEIMYGLPRILEVSPDEVPEKRGKSHSQEPAQRLTGEDQPVPDLVTRFANVQDQMDALIQEKKPFLDPDFSINSLAVDLKVPVHHLRYFFARHLKISFTTYKNKLRVDYVKQLIEQKEDEKHSVEGLGQLAGFSSKSSFFAAFKTETGMSPLEYQKTLQTRS